MGDNIVLQLIFKIVCDLALDLVALGILVTLTITSTKFMSVFVLAQMERIEVTLTITPTKFVSVYVLATSIGRIDVNDETMRKFYHMVTITSLLCKNYS